MAITEQQRRILEDMAALAEVYRESHEFDQHEFHRTFLITEALVRNQLMPMLVRAKRPRAVTVIGGTNVGKSTIANALLGAPVASSDTKAAHTRNAAAFIPPSLDADTLFGDYECAFAGSEQTAYQATDQHGGHQYYVEPIRGDTPLGETILWDTPDVDSTLSQDYLHAVIEAATLSDVVVLVTTAQKYADDRVVRLVAMLMDVGVQPVVCFNQHKPDYEALVQQVRDTLITAMRFQPMAATDIPVYRLPYLTNSDELYSYPSVLAMRNDILNRLSQPRPDNTECLVTYLRQHLHEILTPMLARVEAFDAWNSAVHSASETMYADYETNYINNPDKYDAFKEANTYMLHIVTANMQGMQGLLQRARQLSSTPTKFIQQVTQATFVRANNMMNPALDNKAKRSNDLQAIRAANVQLNDSLTELINTNRQRANSHAFWDAVERVWLTEQESVLQKFEDATLSHWQASQVQIAQSAERIYHELEKDPRAIQRLKDIASWINGGALGGQLGLIFIHIPGTEFLTIAGPFDMVDPLFTLATPRIMAVILESTTTRSIIKPIQVDLQGFFKHSARQLIQDYCEKPLLDVGVMALEQLGGLRLKHYDSMKTLHQRIKRLLEPLTSDSDRFVETRDGNAHV